MSDRKKLFSDFASSLGALVSEALSELNPEKAQMVSAALSAGTHKIQIAIDADPLVVVGFLRPRDPSEPSHPLFRIDGGMPSGESH